MVDQSNQTTGGTLALLACSKSKQAGELPAREKYAAPRANLFKKSREYVETAGVEYLILSGKYGALEPSDVIGDYNVSVRDRDAGEWREDVVDALQERDVDLDAYGEIVVLAGSDYYEPLADLLEDADAEVSRPLADCAGYGYMVGELSDMIEAQRVATDGGEDRLTPEGDGGDNPFEIGDAAAYGGNWSFHGEVVRVHARSVWIRDDTGAAMCFDWMDLNRAEADGGRELPDELAGVEEGDEIRVTADDGRYGVVETTMTGRIEEIEHSNDILEVEVGAVTGGGSRSIASERATLFAWEEPSGGWQPLCVQYALEATKGMDSDRDNQTTEVAALERVDGEEEDSDNVIETVDETADSWDSWNVKEELNIHGPPAHSIAETFDGPRDVISYYFGADGDFTGLEGIGGSTSDKLVKVVRGELIPEHGVPGSPEWRDLDDEEDDVLATGDEAQATFVKHGSADDLDRDNSDRCHAIRSGGIQCDSRYTSGAADTEAKLCGTHAGSRSLSRIDEVEGEPYADLRDDLAEAGLADSHAYYLATLTDDVEELWRVATGLETVDVGGKTYTPRTLATLADDIAEHPDLDVHGHPLAHENCVAVIPEGSYGENYQCRTGSYGSNLLCGMHSDSDDPYTIYDRDGTDLDRVEIDGEEYLAIESRGDDLIAVTLPEYEVVRLEGVATGVQDVATDETNKPSLSSDGAGDDQEDDVEANREDHPEDADLRNYEEGERLRVSLKDGREYTGEVVDTGTGGWEDNSQGVYLRGVESVRDVLVVEQQKDDEGRYSGELTAYDLDVREDDSHQDLGTVDAVDRVKEDTDDVIRTLADLSRALEDLCGPSVEVAETLEGEDHPNAEEAEHVWRRIDELVEDAKAARTAVELAEAGEIPAGAARELAVEEIAALLDRGLSPSQALDYYATESEGALATHGGYSQGKWSDRRDRSQQAISDSVRKARETLEESGEGA